jgi:transcriptional regulator with XRE-family HTH domain
MENWNSETQRDFRTSQGWSQAELAEKAGVSKKMVWYWEKGKELCRGYGFLLAVARGKVKSRRKP